MRAVSDFVIGEPEDLGPVESLQQKVWGCSQLDIVPAHLLRAQQLHGGCLLAAWQEGELVGFVYGFPGRPGEDYLLSHLAAVEPRLQGQGLGRRLKEAQADWARQRGYRRIVWTFDPLQAANARLNIRRLGAVANRYRRHYYGDLDDDLNRGIPTDRLEVDWWLQGVESSALELEIQYPWPLPSPQRAHWRMHTREHFEQAFQRGLSVTDFDIQDGWARYGLRRVVPR